MNDFFSKFLKEHLPFFILIIFFTRIGEGNWQLLALPVWLYYWRQNDWKTALGFSLPLVFGLNFIGQYGMVPFPLPMLLIVALVTALIFLAPFWLDRMIYQKLPLLIQLLVLPAAATIFNLFMTNGPTGSMGFIGNQLVEIHWLMQLTSVIGIFGIGFLMYLFASVSVYLFQKAQVGKFDKITFSICTVLFMAMIIWGNYRVKIGEDLRKNTPTVKIATITDEQTHLGEALYEAYTGENIKIDREISQADPVNQMVSKALLAFKDEAEDPKYASVWNEIERHFEYMLEESRKAVSQGAKIIVLSEGEIITTKNREQVYIQAFQDFAAEHQVYYFLGIASMIPDLTFPENPFVENKIIVINDRGEIEDVYFKNVPVEGADPSVPGDGIMRAIATPYGRLAYAICYDTDFPDLMRQVGKLQADILLVPTGDWKAISPYHTQTTNIRSIENGFAQVRAVSGGLSSAVDAYGNYLATDDFFEDFDHLMITDVPIQAVDTVYTRVGDLLTYLSWLVLGLAGLILVFRIKR